MSDVTDLTSKDITEIKELSGIFDDEEEDEDIEYPYEHEWDDITVICNQFPQGVEISNECVRRIINDESTKS